MPAFPRSTIESSNTTCAFTIPGVFTTPQTLAQFAADDVQGSDPIETAEVIMGVDGTQSQGFIYQSIRQRWFFAPNSPSVDIFDNWYLAQKLAGAAFSAFAVFTQPSLNRKFLCNNGALSLYQPMADGKKILQTRTMQITWQEVFPAQIA